MGSNFNPQYVVRGLNAVDVAPGNLDGRPAINGRGDACVVQGLPPLSELVRLGQSYYSMQVTGVAPVAALPTTTAMLSLWNGEQVGGKSYVIDSVMACNIVSQAAASSVGLLGMINPPTVAAPTSSLTPASLSGNSTYRGKGRVSLAVTVTNNGWFALGTSVEMSQAANAMSTMDVDCRGMYILPPGAMMSLVIISATTVATSCISGFRWHEVQLALG